MIKHLKSKEEFDELIKGGKPVLVDFYAEWCGPCQMMGPILEDMSENYKNAEKVEIAKVDVDELKDVAGEYDVMSIPTFGIFADGKLVETLVGMRGQDELMDKLDEQLK